MKTKISHLGRSTVSVILAVMMLLSTMLIGTVSTVNAVGADSSHTVHKGETLYLDLSSQTNAARVSFLENDYADGGKAYFDKLPDDKIVSVKLSQDLNFSTYERRLFSYFNSSEVNVNNDRYNNLPTAGQNMVVVEANGTSYHWDTYTPVADKVSLTASPTSVKVGKDVTLTATLGTLATGLNDANVTYTFEQKKRCNSKRYSYWKHL